MGDRLESKKRWWLIFNYFRPEPNAFRLLYLISFFITLVFIFSAVLVARVEHGSWSGEPKISCKPPLCERQRTDWAEFLDKAEDKYEAAKVRIESLTASRSDSNSKNFTQSWSWYELEIAQLEDVIKNYKKKKPKVTPPIQFYKLLVPVMLSLIFYIYICRIIVLHVKSAFRHIRTKKNGEGIVRNWTLPHVISTFLIAILMAVAEISTSICATGKEWFGWDSFCVTHSAFVIKCISFISFGLVAASPFTVLWCVTREINIPKLVPYALDRKFGAKKYVEFLQTWTLWLILAPSAVGLLWVRYITEMEPNFMPARFLHAAGVAVLITLIAIRMVKNAIILRYRCNDLIERQGHKWKGRIPEDPTIAFIGTAWWKFPATITAAFASIWMLLEGLGLTKILLHIIR